jgi:hypothetical protein
MKKVELFNDHFQNFKVYGIPHAQLIIADPPYIKEPKQGVTDNEINADTFGAMGLRKKSKAPETLNRYRLLEKKRQRRLRRQQYDRERYMKKIGLKE